MVREGIRIGPSVESRDLAIEDEGLDTRRVPLYIFRVFLIYYSLRVAPKVP
jgi:hypothetical protein